jgi:hypothetical protein
MLKGEVMMAILGILVGVLLCSMVVGAIIWMWMLILSMFKKGKDNE